MRFSKKEEYLRQKDKKLKKIIDENNCFKPIKKTSLIHLWHCYLTIYINKSSKLYF